ncbi:LysR family transcriptional regulator [Pseudovibrio brasiliensis]|uniref:LysR family transcriptional regulator n=1 Tax=Pseudovibrio brasiliensis TaxID=1898042 RepID=A0ABX8AV05_9HYPH|nr:LysR family transcriptional regulator [Pseudovibrio brasiliensis]QUS57086.1 LysR family transcriptional regulator [Pseudovibrio brasiliensis]
MKSSDWELMPAFLAVARAGSLRAGAELLHTNYGTVNRNIQALEASYGVALFVRSTKGFKLTEAGEAVLPFAEQAEQVIINARKRVEGLDKTEAGTLRFSVTPTFAYDVITPIISRFQEAYPDIQVALRLTSAVENINKDETDVSLRAAYDVSGDVVARKLYPMAMGIYASKAYIDNVFAKAGPQGAGLSWIGWPENGPFSNWISQSAFPQADVRHSVSDGYMRLQMLREGCGISPMPVVFEKYFPDLCRVPGTPLEFGQTLWIVLHADLRKTVRIRRFVDFLADALMELRPDMQGELYRR